MAIFDARIPLASADIVRIRRAGDTVPGFFNEFSRFGGARPIKATIAEGARLMSHPVENGQVITDHRVILPVVISIAVVLRSFDYRSVYRNIREDFRNTVQFEIQTKTDTYQNMYLRDIPHEEAPEVFDTVTMVLEFVEAQFFNVRQQELIITEVEQPPDTSTVDRGEQANVTPPGSILSRGVDSIANSLGGGP